MPLGLIWPLANGLIVEDCSAYGGFVVRHALPEHRVLNATAMEKLMDLTETSESQRSASPVPEKTRARRRHNLDDVVSTAVRDDSSRYRACGCHMFQLPGRHIRAPAIRRPSSTIAM